MQPSQQTAVLWESHFPLVHCFPYPLARALFVLPGPCLVSNTFYWTFSGAFQFHIISATSWEFCMRKKERDIYIDNTDTQDVIVNTNNNVGRNIKAKASEFITIPDSRSLRSDLYLGTDYTITISCLVVGFPVHSFFNVWCWLLFKTDYWAGWIRDWIQN